MATDRPEGKKLLTINLEQLAIDPAANARRSYSNILELATDMLRRGQLQPIVVKKLTEPLNGQTHSLVFGFRRCKAAQKLGWRSIMALEIGDLTEKEVAEYRYAENSKREPVSVLDEAEFVLRYVRTHFAEKAAEPEAEITKQAVADALNMSRDRFRKLFHIAQKLEPEVKELVRNSKMVTSLTDLYEVSRAPASEQCQRWYNLQNLSERDVAALRLKIAEIMDTKDKKKVSRLPPVGTTVADRVGMAVEAIAHGRMIRGMPTTEYGATRKYLWILLHFLRDGGELPFEDDA
jgi:ParB/RepB/Spo0J family partition protein